MQVQTLPGPTELSFQTGVCRSIASVRRKDRKLRCQWFSHRRLPVCLANSFEHERPRVGSHLIQTRESADSPQGLVNARWDRWPNVEVVTDHSLFL